MELLERLYKMIEEKIQIEEALRDDTEIDEQHIHESKLECLHWIQEKIEELQDFEAFDEIFQTFSQGGVYLGEYNFQKGVKVMDFATSMFIVFNTGILTILGGIFGVNSFVRFVNRRKRAISTAKK